jgi:hypothetical protein
MWYIVESRESDGNDCSVTDHIVEADDAKAAVNKVCNELERRATERGIGMESGGGFGYYFECDCDIPEGEEDSWECSHGGVDVAEPDQVQAFATFDAVQVERALYHSHALDIIA